MAFLGDDEMLVLEKASGQVKRVVRGQVRDVVLDLAVNSGSERGLLGIALHPKFRRNVADHDEAPRLLVRARRRGAGGPQGVLDQLPWHRVS